jgi:hypothetical protein
MFNPIILQVICDFTAETKRMTEYEKSGAAAEPRLPSLSVILRFVISYTRTAVLLVALKVFSVRLHSKLESLYNMPATLMPEVMV